MAEVRMSLDEFEDILENIPGKTLTAKVRYALQFHEEVTNGRKITFIHRDSKGKSESVSAYYSERLDNLYLKMCKQIYRNLGLTLEEMKDEGMLD
jgi:hypothetical protein